MLSRAFLDKPLTSLRLAPADTNTDLDAWRTALNKRKKRLLQQARQTTAQAAAMAVKLQDAAKQAEAAAAAAACDVLEHLGTKEVRHVAPSY